jgi:DNA-binding response OmpR family regulator
MDQANGREPVVVLVEDDPTDIEAFLRVAQRQDPSIKVLVAKTVAEANSLIDASRAASDLRLVVLDFLLGSENSLPVLAKVRSPKDMLRVPVVMFTGQAAPSDMDMAERIGANSVIRKPSDYTEFAAQVEAMLSYWFSHNLVPMKDR